jgi:alpha-galactosidase
LFISAQHEAAGEEQRTVIRESFRIASEVNPPGEPLDWLTNPTPAHWRLRGKDVMFHWT